MHTSPFTKTNEVIFKTGLKIPMAMIQLIKTNPKFKHMIVRVNYQQLSINTNPANYDNLKYFKKVWKKVDFAVDEAKQSFYTFKIKNTIINADKTKFIFNNMENNSIYTIENISQELGLKISDKMIDFNLQKLILSILR